MYAAERWHSKEVKQMESTATLEKEVDGEEAKRVELTAALKTGVNLDGENQ